MVLIQQNGSGTRQLSFNSTAWYGVGLMPSPSLMCMFPAEICSNRHLPASITGSISAEV